MGSTASIQDENVIKFINKIQEVDNEENRHIKLLYTNYINNNKDTDINDFIKEYYNDPCISIYNHYHNYDKLKEQYSN